MRIGSSRHSFVLDENYNPSPGLDVKDGNFTEELDGTGYHTFNLNSGSKYLYISFSKSSVSNGDIYLVSIIGTYTIEGIGDIGNVDEEIKAAITECKSYTDNKISSYPGSSIFYNGEYEYAWFNGLCAKKSGSMLYRTYNTARASSTIANNSISLLQTGDVFQHDSAACFSMYSMSTIRLTSQTIHKV